MADLGNAVVSVIADTSGFEDSLNEALTRSTNLVASKLAAPGIVSGFAVNAIKQFLPLEKEINRIFQINPKTFSEAAFDQLAENILNMSDRVGVGAEQIAQGIGEAVGKGFEQGVALGITESSATLAKATQSELSPAVQAVTGVMNVYGESLYDAEKAADLLWKTTNYSRVPLSQLSSSLGNVTAAASQSGIGLEDVGAALATMRAQNLTASESTTQLRTFLDEMNQSTSQGGKVFAALTGKSFPEFIKQGGTLQEAILLIQDASKKTGIPINQMVSNINAGNAIMALGVKEGQTYNQFLARMNDETQSVGDAAAVARQGGLVQFQEAMESVRNAMKRVALEAKPLQDFLVSLATGGIQFLGTVINQIATGLSNVNWSAVIAQLQPIKDAFKAMGDVIMQTFIVLSMLDWTSIGRAVAALIAPLIFGFKLLAEVMQFVAAAIGILGPMFAAFFNFIAPVLPVLAATFVIVSKLAVVFGILAVVFNRVLPFVRAMGPVMSRLLVVFRALVPWITRLIAGFIRMRLAFLMTPWGIAITALTLLVTAFMDSGKAGEKFREIVVNAVNTVKNAVVTAIEWMVRAWIDWARTIGGAIENVLRFWGKLPWIGGKFDDMADWVAGQVRALDVLENKVISLANSARAMNWELSQGKGWFNEGVDQTGMRIEDLWGKDLPGSTPAIPEIPQTNLDALNALFDEKDKAGSKKKATDYTKRMRDLIAGVFKAVRDFAKTIGKASVDQIQNGFDNIIQKYNDAIQDATDVGQKKTADMLKKSLKQFKTYEASLVKLAKKRDGLDTKLKAAQESLKALTDDAKQFSKTTKDAFVSLGSVATASAGIGVTFRGIRNNLKDAIRTTQQFDTAIRKLQDLGLNKASLKQLADAGPAALDQAMALARSGKLGIEEINKLQAELEKMAGTNATNLTNEFFQAGVKAAEGLVAGLKSQKSAIVKEMESIANAMVATIKKGLKIKSPSQVFADEVGAQIPAGMAVGVRRGTPDVIRAIQAMSNGGGNVTFGPGSVEINGVADPAAARRAGLLAGSAVVAIMERNAAKQRLAGVG